MNSSGTITELLLQGSRRKQEVLALAAVTLAVLVGAALAIRGAQQLMILVALLLVGGLAIVTFVRPPWGAAVLLWVIYFNPWVNDVLSHSEFPFVGKVAGGVVLLSWLASQIVHGRVHVRLGRSFWPLVGLLIHAMLSAWANGALDQGAFTLIGTGLAYYVLIVNLFLEDHHFDAFIAHLIAVGVLLALLGSVQAVQAGFAERVTLVDTGGASNPNDFALLLTIVLPFVLAWPTARGRWRSGMRLLALFLLLVVIVVSGSRTGVVVATLIVLAYGLRDSSVLLLAMVGVGLVVAVYPYVPTIPHFVDRFLNRIWLGQAGVYGRMLAIRSGIEMGWDHPLFGVGARRWDDVIPMYEHYFHMWTPVSPHNTYLQAFAELGFPGLALLLAVLGLAGFRLWRLWRNRAQLGVEARWLWAMCVLLPGYLIFIGTLNHLYGRDLFIVLGLIEAYCNFVERGQGRLRDKGPE